MQDDSVISGVPEQALSMAAKGSECDTQGTSRVAGRGRGRGTIEVIMGPMFSGKSTELLRKLQRHRIARKKVLLIKHRSDERYPGSDRCVVTHDHLKNEAQLIVSEIDESLFESADYQAAEVVGIDEAQFFGANLPELVDRIAHEGKTVIVAGLDGDFKREQFGYLVHLIPMAEKVKKMTAVCLECGLEASFTARTKFNDSSHKAERVAIVGGSEMYKPVCRHCYNASLRPTSSDSQGHATAAAASSNPGAAETSPLAGNDEETMTASQNETTLESGQKRKHRQARGQLGDDSHTTLAL